MARNKASDYPDWVYKPDIPHSTSVGSASEFLSNSRLYEAVLSSIQDGISILGTDMSVIYMNKSMAKWYPGRRRHTGRKCYEAFHNRTEPCNPCPTVRAMSAVSPQTELVPYTKGGKQLGWQKVYAVPVVDNAGKVVLVIEYIRDITFQKRAETDKDHLTELYENLEAQNRLLMEIIDQREKYESGLVRTVNENIEKYVKPALGYLKNTMSERDYAMISAIVNEMVLPVTTRSSSPLERLTPRELQITTLIKEGLSSKEIAATLHLSKKTVDYHRSNIRKKLDIGDKNLRVYLSARG